MGKEYHKRTKVSVVLSLSDTRGAVVSLLNSGTSGLGSSPTVVFLGTLCHSASLRQGILKWVPGNCERERRDGRL